MNANQADRAVIARRATPSTTTSTGRPGTNLLAREITRVERAVPARRNRRATRMTSIQRNSIGRRSEWNRSPYAPRGGWR